VPKTPGPDTFLWRLCCAAAIALSILSFTPLVMPVDEIEPMLFGVPRTLWMGFLIAIVFEAVVILAGFVHPRRGVERREEEQ